MARQGMPNTTDGLVCFVCDNVILGRYYALATCRTQTSKVRLIEKLGHLVGEDYMVVVSEDDVICRGCASMINSLDRLEKELGSVKSVVMRFLEKKYDLNDGEQVSARSNLSVFKARDIKPEFLSTDFQAKKKRSMAGDIDPDLFKDTKDTTWVQCDTCKYTTHSHILHMSQLLNRTSSSSSSSGKERVSVVQNSLQQQHPTHQQQIIRAATTHHQNQHILVQHVQLESKQNGSSKSPVIRMQGIGQGSEESQLVNMDHVVEIKKDVSDLQDSETVEMIAAEMGQGLRGGGTVVTVSGRGSSDEPCDSQGGDVVETTQMLHMAVGPEGKPMTLQAIEGEDGANTLCMVDEHGMIVQKVEQAEDGTLYVQMTDNADPTKQVLSVAEDGSVQMVEVLWDEMVAPDENETHGMVSF